MTSQDGTFNGRSDSEKAGIPQKRPKGWARPKAANPDDIDAALARRLWAVTDGIVEKHRARYSHHKANQR